MPHNLGVFADYTEKRGGKTVVVPDAEHNVQCGTVCGKTGQPNCAIPDRELRYHTEDLMPSHIWGPRRARCVTRDYIHIPEGNTLSSILFQRYV
jgi:hypothetical protein